MQIRQAHTDLRVPDFSYYRRPTSKDATTRYEDSAANRKLFTYVVTGAMGVSVAYMAKNVVRGFVSMLAPAKDVIALASIEVDLAEIPEGKSATFTWRGKPLFVRHRLPAEIDDVRQFHKDANSTTNSTDTNCALSFFYYIAGTEDCRHGAARPTTGF